MPWEIISGNQERGFICTRYFSDEFGGLISASFFYFRNGKLRSAI